MFEKSCRCGKTKKNFKIDIGEFFINECCEAEGYDHTGKKKVDAEDLGLNKDQLDQQLNSQETQSLEIQDEGEQPDPAEAQQEEIKEEAEVDEEVDMDKEVEEAIQETAKPLEEEKSEEADPQAEQAPATEAPVKKKRQYNRSGQIKKES